MKNGNVLSAESHLQAHVSSEGLRANSEGNLLRSTLQPFLNSLFVQIGRFKTRDPWSVQPRLKYLGIPSTKPLRTNSTYTAVNKTNANTMTKPRLIFYIDPHSIYSYIAYHYIRVRLSKLNPI